MVPFLFSSFSRRRSFQFTTCPKDIYFLAQNFSCSWQVGKYFLPALLRKRNYLGWHKMFIVWSCHVKLNGGKTWRPGMWHCSFKSSAGNLVITRNQTKHTCAWPWWGIIYCWLHGLLFLFFSFLPPASAVFNTELHVCIQRITSVLFYEIHRAGLLFYPSCVWILLSCVILAAEGSQALELCNVFSLCRSRKLFMGWYLILLLDFLTKLDLTVFWKSHHFSREFSE